MALLLLHTWLLMSLFYYKALIEDAWVLEYAFSVLVVNLYGFCLSIVYSVC